MEKEIIAIDIDDTVAETVQVFIEWFNKKNNTNFSYNEMNKGNYNLSYLKIKEENLEQTFEAFHKSKEYESIKPIKGAVKSLSKLKEKYELIAITARPENWAEKTEKFINLHFPSLFSKIYYTTIMERKVRIKKSDICKKIGAKIIIEDSYNNGIECALEGIKSILIDMPWNRKEDYSHDNIEYTKNWEEIEELLLN